MYPRIPEIKKKKDTFSGLIVQIISKYYDNNVRIEVLSLIYIQYTSFFLISPIIVEPVQSRTCLFFFSGCEETKE